MPIFPPTGGGGSSGVPFAGTLILNQAKTAEGLDVPAGSAPAGGMYLVNTGNIQTQLRTNNARGSTVSGTAVWSFPIFTVPDDVWITLAMGPIGDGTPGIFKAAWFIDWYRTPFSSGSIAILGSNEINIGTFDYYTKQIRPVASGVPTLTTISMRLVFTVEETGGVDDLAAYVGGGFFNTSAPP